MPLAVPAYQATQFKTNIENVWQSPSFENNVRYKLFPVHGIGNLIPLNLGLIEKLQVNFSSELKNKFSYFAGYNPFLLIDSFATASSFILQFKPDTGGVELTKAKSIFLSFSKGDERIFVELFLENEIEEPVEAVVNIYKNKELQLSYAGSLKDSFTEIKSYFHPASQQGFFFNKSYAVSATTAPEYQLQED